MDSNKVLPLSQDERAVVKSTALFWHHTKWQLHALTIKPTHVHIVATILKARAGEWYSYSEILHSVKKTSSRAINKRWKRRGTLWESETYDHIIRNEQEFSAAFDYLLQNAAEEIPGQDPYTYDGFWCEGNEYTQPVPVTEPSPLAIRPVNPRVITDVFIKREKKLPHWEMAGATYHFVISLLGYKPKEKLLWPYKQENIDTPK